MPLYVFVTDACKNDATRHGQSSLVKNLEISVGKTQNLTGFSFFRPTHFLKKNLGRSFRLIAYRVPVGNDELILFLRVLARGSNDYENFLSGWDKETGITRQLVPYEDADFKAIHDELTRTSPRPPLPVPSDEERRWLYEVFQEEELNDELLTLETETWVKKMREPGNREFLALYHQMLEQMEPDVLHPSDTNTDCHIHWENKQRIGVAYLYRPDLNRLLLLEPLRHPIDDNSVLAKHRKHLSRVREGQHELSRIAARSYPLLMVLDQDAWLRIQKDEEANLALSPEEAELLESIRQAGAKDELGYPLFINGRAGSGKSTMLQYLAADYVDFSLRQRTTQLPLYMTCSPDLLERARETVRGLLTAHHERLLEGAHDPTEVSAVLSRSFVVFHNFLYSLLPDEEQKKLPQDRYVNYSRFRQLWTVHFEKRPEARRMSPDVSWHAIRSYIKGIRSSKDEELGPEEFMALPRRRRSISQEAYREIYDRVWCSWYKRLCEEKDYWDDQDLAAAVLDSGAVSNNEWAAVFCDEAQDFTPVELDIIFQLSLFGRRSLQAEELRRVPIVFAGDPLQTINPTGFRWDAVCAYFHERFCAVLDPRERARIDLSYKELRLNYRSNPGIVRFCNLIQLVRAALLDARGVKPQEAWWMDTPSQTVWAAACDSETTQQLKRHSELVKLVNCEDGEESGYAQKDSILKAIEEESGGVYRNVLGPTRAKGLEFPAVVLYRFGESAPEGFLELLNGDVSVGDREKRLPYEYFLNRLYVAASRAKGQLIVVDSREALQTFWEFATNTEVQDRLMARAGGREVWKDAVTCLAPIKERAWSGERVDPREQAAEYSTQGQRKRDAYLLRQAALAYRSAGDEHESGKCIALAAECENKYGEAGKKYQELGLNEDAFRCYWIARDWQTLCNLAARETNLTTRLESRAADFMTRADEVESTFLDALASAALEDDSRGDLVSDVTWRAFVLPEVAERLSKNMERSRIPWQKLNIAFKRFVGDGVPVTDTQRAAIAYAAGDFSEAVRLWERSGGPERKEYKRAKALTTPFPGSLEWFGKLKDHSEVLRQWREHGRSSWETESIEDEGIHAVADAAIERGDLQLAVEMVRLRPDRERAAKLLIASLRAANRKALIAAAVLATRLYVKEREWAAAVRAAEQGYFSELGAATVGDISFELRKMGGDIEVMRAVVYELAMSENLPMEAADSQAIISGFLHRHFVGRGNKGGARTDQYGIPPQVVGAAIERTGRIVDALQYYEHLERTANTSEVKRFAAQRLVRSLERHAEYFRSRGDEGQARQREVRAQQIRDRLGLGTRAIPDYPTVDRSVERASHTKWVCGPLKIVLSKVHGRLRIEHTERFETVTVDVKERSLLGDARFSEITLQSQSSESSAWKVDGWGTVIELQTGEQTKCIIRLDEARPLEILIP